MDKKIKIEDFYKKYFGSGERGIKITLEMMLELKNEGITTEQFLD
jgi:hypothetical protein